MRWSIRSLLLHMAVFSVCLTLCYLPYAELGGIALLAVVIALALWLPSRLWRYLAWGAVGGVVVAFIAAGLYTRFRVGSLPPTYASNAQIAAVHDLLRPYLFPMGTFAGGTVGWLLYQRKRSAVRVD
jgi:hypothetical protein